MSPWWLLLIVPACLFLGAIGPFLMLASLVTDIASFVKAVVGPPDDEGKGPVIPNERVDF